MSDNITPLREDTQSYLRIPLASAKKIMQMCGRAMDPGTAQYVLGQVYAFFNLSMNNNLMAQEEKE